MPYSNIKLTETSNIESLTVAHPANRLYIDVNGQTLNVGDDVDIDAGGQFQFYDWEADSYDMNNGQIVVGDELTLRGHPNEDLQINNLDFVAESGNAYYCTVSNSQNTGTIDIDASDGTSTDNEGNTGWYFGATVVAAALRVISIFKSNIFNSLLFKR